MKIESTLEQMKNDSDWRQAFEYSGQKEDVYTCLIGDPKIVVVGNISVNQNPFTLDDISYLIGSVQGEHEVSEWVAIGCLKDGRYFHLRASCDYTGWS